MPSSVYPPRGLAATFGLPFALIVGSALPARAQSGDKPRNPKVLAADLSRDSIVKIMRFTVASGLGVTCGYCHGAPGVPIDSIDFASAERQTKAHGARDQDTLGVLARFGADSALATYERIKQRYTAGSRTTSASARSTRSQRGCSSRTASPTRAF